MSFLQKIDELFEASCLQFSVPLKSDNFHTYIPIEIYNDTYRFQFLIRKGKKSKILILAGQQRVYLTDDQIIRTILSMEDNETEWFLAQFISLYVGNGVQTTLELDKTKFTYTGLPSFPEERDILLFSDTNIKLSHFCFLLNFIFAKDQCWGKMSNTPNFEKKTLCKYISIIDYYHNASTYSKVFLKGLGYPVKYAQSSNYISTQKAFKEIDCVEKFDISYYL